MSTVQCSHCGRSFNAVGGSAAVMCPECGSRVEAIGTGTSVSTQAKASKTAITSLIFGVIGIVPCFCGVPSLLALILGIIAFVRDSGTRVCAIIGLVLGGVGLVVNIVAAPIMLALLLPAVQASREAARRASCTVKLKNIGLEIIAYRQSHNDDFPPSLEVLASERHLDPKLLQCPTDEGPADHPDYVYAPPAVKDMHETMIACDSEGRHPGLRNVLFTDGAVKSVSTDEFLKNLREPQNRNLADALLQHEQQWPPEPPRRH